MNPRALAWLVPLLLAALAVPATLLVYAHPLMQPGPTANADAGSEIGSDPGFIVGADGSAPGAAEPRSIAPPSLSRPPRCVEETEYHNHLIYAVPADRGDRYDFWAPIVRQHVAAANAILNQEAEAFGRNADYKFACDADGQIRIEFAVLSSWSLLDDYETIVRDLRDLGFDSPFAKYWVWYDDPVGLVGGESLVRDDDRASVDNANNQGNDFAIAYVSSDSIYAGDYGRLVLQHESAHSMGAVQRSAPHADRAWHCLDGRDIMCLPPEAPAGADLAEECLDRPHVDCHNDDFFHPNPPVGHYLHDHWNLGSALNRFLAISS